MSGFILGTGSGILASAAVYYTLSTSLRESTAGLRSELHNSSTLLSNSFEPVKPPAPSSLIGPSSLNPVYQPSFGTIVKQKWNETLTSVFSGVRETDWEGVGKNIVETGQNVIDRISETTSNSTPSTNGETTSYGIPPLSSPVAETTKNHTTVGVVPGTTGLIDNVEKIPETKVGIDKSIGLDLRKDSYGVVQGNEVEEALKKNAQKEGRRLV
ncbi:uncharacterized protein L201_000595 [Kwoniella dendrophila CBS 6074]|uniref:MICOS complex subunit MIC12 n=1 Tax=Kwoniella dendrophila CBS 6074 TaxID=1295534 RepID=A0AAX4JLG7_9TREE